MKAKSRFLIVNSKQAKSGDRWSLSVMIAKNRTQKLRSSFISKVLLSHTVSYIFGLRLYLPIRQSRKMNRS